MSGFKASPKGSPKVAGLGSPSLSSPRLLLPSPRNSPKFLKASLYKTYSFTGRFMSVCLLVLYKFVVEFALLQSQSLTFKTYSFRGRFICVC